MKNHIIISLLILLFGCSTSEKQSNKKSQIEHNKELQKEYDFNDLIKMENGLWTEKFSDEPISGKVYDYFGKRNNLTKVYIGNLRNGKKEGEWIEWDRNGRKKWEETYRDGNIISEKYWYDNGKAKNEYNYKNGKKNGLVTYWYRNGQKKFEGAFKNGEKEGLHTRWHENGRKEEGVTFKNGKKEGLHINWMVNGQMRYEVNYKDGLMNGELRIWSNVGSLMHKTVFIDGNGVIIMYYNNGLKKFKGTYKNEKKEGVHTRWHENGQQEAEVTFKEGRIKDGLVRYWHDNGLRRYQGTYKNGEKEGKWTSWNINGKKEKEENYKDGMDVSRDPSRWELPNYVNSEEELSFSIKFLQDLPW